MGVSGPRPGEEKDQQSLGNQVHAKEARKLRARRRRGRGVWFGLGAFGVVGWSVAIPTLIGLALGLWIDATWPSQASWTLMLMLGGVILGCVNAWRWLRSEMKSIEDEERRIEEEDQAMRGGTAEDHHDRD